jgi:hypothetical protein
VAKVIVSQNSRGDKYDLGIPASEPISPSSELHRVPSAGERSGRWFPDGLKPARRPQPQYLRFLGESEAHQ